MYLCSFYLLWWSVSFLIFSFIIIIGTLCLSPTAPVVCPACVWNKVVSTWIPHCSHAQEPVPTQNTAIPSREQNALSSVGFVLNGTSQAGEQSAFPGSDHFPFKVRIFRISNDNMSLTLTLSRWWSDAMALMVVTNGMLCHFLFCDKKWIRELWQEFFRQVEQMLNKQQTNIHLSYVSILHGVWAKYVPPPSWGASERVTELRVPSVSWSNHYTHTHTLPCMKLLLSRSNGRDVVQCFNVTKERSTKIRT